MNLRGPIFPQYEYFNYIIETCIILLERLNSSLILISWDSVFAPSVDSGFDGFHLNSTVAEFTCFTSSEWLSPNTANIICPLLPIFRRFNY